jgi:hypothetical protein
MKVVKKRSSPPKNRPTTGGLTLLGITKVRKSTRKSTRKSPRKSPRKSIRKSTRKSRSPSPRKSRSPTRRQPIRRARLTEGKIIVKRRRGG